jgi:hypothetical protein
MVYDEKLANRIRTALGDRHEVTERKMFGGIAFMVADRMACGVIHDDLMAKVGPDRWEEALARPHARPMDFTGRPMRGMVYVGPAGVRTAAALQRWVDQCVAFAIENPAKKPARKKTPVKKPRVKKPAKKKAAARR